MREGPLLSALNIFFFVFHSCLILFILSGWIWRKLRKIHLIVILFTAFSWFFLGIWYGFGYCPSTDWHWQVRDRLGYYDQPDSYTKFLFDSFTGLDIPVKTIDTITVSFLTLVICASLLVNIRDWIRSKKS